MVNIGPTSQSQIWPNYVDNRGLHCCRELDGRPTSAVVSLQPMVTMIL